MKKIFVWVSILLIAFLAGCEEILRIGTPEKPEIAKGVMIDVLYKPEVKSLDELTLNINVTNDGDSTAKKIKIELRGLTEEWKVDGKTFVGIDFKEIESLGHKIAAKGESKSISWQLIAPSKIVEFEYPFEIKVSYDYSTIYEGLFKVVSLEYSKEKGDKGAILESANSRAPVHVEIKMLEEGFVVKDGKVRVVVHVKNVGDGEIEKNKVVFVPKNLECPKNEIVFKIEAGKQEKEATMDCNLIAKDVKDYANIFARMDLNYRYLTLRTGKIKVLPIE